ncbi:MAG: alpha/beta family hydrolase [Acidimicrobiia bacterium]
MIRRLRIEWKSGEKVTGRLAMPDRPRSLGVLLAHGAGVGQDSGFIVRVRDGLASHGFPVMTFSYPYAEAGRRRPDPMGTLLACHRAAAARLLRYSDRVALAGKSMGGRMASHLAAEGELHDGLVFYGYPLVPPGRREPRPTDHLHRISGPMLFFTGTRDPLCPLQLLKAVLTELPAATLEVIEGGDHSFKVPKRSGRTWEDVIDEMTRVTAVWLASSSVGATDRGRGR